MKKEIYVCDRCGKEIQHTVRKSKYINAFSKVRKTAEIKTMIAEGCVYLPNEYCALPEVDDIEVISSYDCKSEEYLLCSDCRKLFERFMKNEY